MNFDLTTFDIREMPHVCPPPLPGIRIRSGGRVIFSGLVESSLKTKVLSNLTFDSRWASLIKELVSQAS